MYVFLQSCSTTLCGMVSHDFVLFPLPFPFLWTFFRTSLDVWNLIPGEGSANVVKTMVKEKIQVRGGLDCCICPPRAVVGGSRWWNVFAVGVVAVESIEMLMGFFFQGSQDGVIPVSIVSDFDYGMLVCRCRSCSALKNTPRSLLLGPRPLLLLSFFTLAPKYLHSRNISYPN